MDESHSRRSTRGVIQNVINLFSIHGIRWDLNQLIVFMDLCYFYIQTNKKIKNQEKINSLKIKEYLIR